MRTAYLTRALAAAACCAALVSIPAVAHADPFPDRPGEQWDGQSPDATGCAYLPGRVKLSEQEIGDTGVKLQMFWSSACGGVAWGRLVFPDGRSASSGASVQISRYDVADAGPLQEWDNTAQWSGMIAAISGDCILVRGGVSRSDGSGASAESPQDCS